jgi:hypothetical protein
MASTTTTTTLSQSFVETDTDRARALYRLQVSGSGSIGVGDPGINRAPNIPPPHRLLLFYLRFDTILLQHSPSTTPPIKSQINTRIAGKNQLMINTI